MRPSRWHLDEFFLKTNGEMHDLWRVVDHPMVLRHTALVWISVASASDGILTS
jgi:transposase-like protein